MPYGTALAGIRQASHTGRACAEGGAVAVWVGGEELAPNGRQGMKRYVTFSEQGSVNPGEFPCQISGGKEQPGRTSTTYLYSAIAVPCLPVWEDLANLGQAQTQKE